MEYKGVITRASLGLEDEVLSADEIKTIPQERKPVNFTELLRWNRRELDKLSVIPNWERLVPEAITHGTAATFDTPAPPVDMDAYYDNQKRFARDQRIARNEPRPDGVALNDRDTLAGWVRLLREERLAKAIERTQLPHATTIHERVMPYRVKG